MPLKPRRYIMFSVFIQIVYSFNSYHTISLFYFTEIQIMIKSLLKINVFDSTRGNNVGAIKIKIYKEEQFL